MRLLFTTVMLSCLCSSTAMAEPSTIQTKLTVEEAQLLVYKALHFPQPNGTLDASSKEPEYDGFYAFEGIGLEAGIYGIFSVNSWTGDVWDDWHCKRISSRASELMRAEIKKRFSPVEMKQYNKLRARKIECLYP